MQVCQVCLKLAALHTYTRCESSAWHQCCISVVSRTGICLTSTAGQAASCRTIICIECDASYPQLDKFGLGLHRVLRATATDRRWKEPESSRRLGHKGCACKATHEMHKRSLVGLLPAGLLERNCARMYQRANCSHAVVGAALQLWPCCLEDQCLMGLPQNLYRQAQKRSMQRTVQQSTAPWHAVVASSCIEYLHLLRHQSANACCWTTMELCMPSGWCGCVW